MLPHPQPLPVRYLGVDVSTLLIERLQRDAGDARGGGEGVREFIALDATLDAIPAGFDLVIVRDVLGHLPPADALALLRNIEVTARPRLLLAKTFIEHTIDGATATGAQTSFGLAHGQRVNIFAPPLCARDALRLYADDLDGGYMGLWRIEPDSNTPADDGSPYSMSGPVVQPHLAEQHPGSIVCRR